MGEAKRGKIALVKEILRLFGTNDLTRRILLTFNYA